jgi:hypothetical protein
MGSIEDILKKSKGSRTKTERLMAQMDFPAALDKSSNKISMRDLIKGEKKDLVDFLSMKPKNLADITIERIKAQKDFKVVILDAVVDQAKAIDEIKKNTDLGKQLIDIEKLAMTFALNAAKKLKDKGELKL